jgi:hypothetical protein
VSDSLTHTQAAEALLSDPGSFETREQLGALVRQVDANSSGKITILYSGRIGFFIVGRRSQVRAIGDARERKQVERWESWKASMRAKVGHPFRVIKRQFGYTKARCRGLAKNTAQVLTLFILSNLWMVRRQLLPA